MDQHALSYYAGQEHRNVFLCRIFCLVAVVLMAFAWGIAIIELFWGARLPTNHVRYVSVVSLSCATAGGALGWGIFWASPACSRWATLGLTVIGGVSIVVLKTLFSGTDA